MTSTATMPDDDAIASAEPATLADHLRALGDVDPELVLWTPRPGTATEADLLARGEKLVELYEGTLVRKPMGSQESLVAASLLWFLNTWNRQTRLGFILGADGLFRLAPNLVRLPDISFTLWSSLPEGSTHLQPVLDFPPDLAVEVISPTERPRAIKRKLGEFFAAGTKLVWHIDPRAETLVVYTSPVDFVTLTHADTLDGGRLLPGFRLPMAELFDDPDLKPRQQQPGA